MLELARNIFLYGVEMSRELTSRSFPSFESGLSSLQSEAVTAKLNYVLIVEDEYFIAADVKNVFNLAGCTEVEMVADEQLALALLMRRRPDGAVLDLSLRGKISFRVADLLTEMQIPFVFMTGHEGSVIPSRFERIVRCQKPIGPAYAAVALLRTARRAASAI